MKLFKHGSVILFLLLTACYHRPQNDPIEMPQVSTQGRYYASLVFENLSHGYTDRAQQNLSMALLKSPFDPVVLDTAGYYYEKTGDLKKANFYYHRAVTTCTKSAVVNNNYGAFLCRNGAFKPSVKYFLTAARLSPRCSNIQNQALRNAQYCYSRVKNL